MESKEFTQIYMPLGEPMYRIAYYFLESAEDAEDAVQDLYVKLWNSRDTLDAVHNPKAYCSTLMRNICIDRIRKVTPKRVQIPEDMVADRGDSSDRIETEETIKRLGKAVQDLSDTQRNVLRMKVFEDLSYEQMAERTGMSKLSLRVLVSQARRKIRNSI